ncbi:double hit [Anaeramoeba flamelloides]|uniref:Double hit n=1 Tax=Anaeramoeba flamelloides TaxID=1746091 RepID=A0ABQ8Y3G9_9EUKA|nr:double hit [Anaeramoeba flamelloides]
MEKNNLTRKSKEHKILTSQITKQETVNNGDDINDTLGGDENGYYEYLDTLNIDVKVQEVERNFFQKKSRVSEKYISKILTFQFLLYHIILSVVYFLGDIKYIENCDIAFLKWSTLLIYFTVYINTVILIVSIFLIRKIKDNYKIKNEINLTIIAIIIYIIIIYIPHMFEKIDYHLRWPILIFAFPQFLITFGYPIYWTYRFEKNKKKIHFSDLNIENKIKHNINDGGNGVTGTGKENSSEEKFLNIINDTEKVKYWIEYSKKNYSVENILFYISVKSFQLLFRNRKGKKKKNKIKNQKIEMAKSILKNFIRHDSHLLVNLSHSVRNQIIMDCEKLLNLDKNSNNNNNKDGDGDGGERVIPKTLFNDALQEITFLMFSDTYPQFLVSSLYFNMVVGVEQIHPDRYLTKNALSNPKITQSKQRKNKTEDTVSNDDIEVPTFNSQSGLSLDGEINTKNNSSID